MTSDTHSTLASAIAASGTTSNGFAIEQRVRWSHDIADEADRLGFEPTTGGEDGEVYFRSPTHTLRARSVERVLLVGHKHLAVAHIEAIVWPTAAAVAMNGQDEALDLAR